MRHAQMCMENTLLTVSDRRAQGNSLENGKASLLLFPLDGEQWIITVITQMQLWVKGHQAGDILAVDDTIWVEHGDDLEHEVFPQELCHGVTAD